MKKNVFLSIKIEHILLILALVSICSTFIFRYKESQKFQILLNRLEYTKDNAQEIFEWDDNKQESYFLDLQDVFKPFTFYNEKVDNCLAEFILLYKNSAMENQNDLIFAKYIQLYKFLYAQQQQLSFGYAWILLISFFISLVSVFSLSEKERIKKNEFKILSVINENQLKLTREIHDGIAQDLAALKISIQNNDGEKTAYFAEQAFSEVRFLLENNNLEIHEDFLTNVKNILVNFERHFGIHTELFSASEHISLLPTNYAFQIIRILNEALSNVARHSEAENVIIRITDTIKGFHFIISDDGIGSTAMNEQAIDSPKTNHFGIENIKSRVAEMNGTVTFDFDGGTTIAISIEDFIS